MDFLIALATPEDTPFLWSILCDAALEAEFPLLTPEHAASHPFVRYLAEWPCFGDGLGIQVIRFVAHPQTGGPTGRLPGIKHQHLRAGVRQHIVEWFTSGRAIAMSELRGERRRGITKIRF